MLANRIAGTLLEDSRDNIHVGSLDQAGAFYGWNFYEGVNNVPVSNANTVFNPADFP